MAKHFSPPTEDEHRRFLIGFLFAGNLKPGTLDCVARGYRDFSRTAHGITKGSNRQLLKQSAHLLVQTALDKAFARTTPWSASSFDDWHEAVCMRVCDHYVSGGFAAFRIGQAQKWINMAVKYALTLTGAGLMSIAEAESLREVAHIPLDGYVLTALAAYDAPTFSCPWSQVPDYNLYFDYQRWLRARFANTIPLDVEFHLWNEEAGRRRA
jgi:hypothetical protein